MAATLTSMNDALIRVYHGNTLVEQLYQGNPFFDMLMKGTKYKVGENHRVTVHTGRSGGTTFLPDGGGTLNTAGQQEIKKADYTYKHAQQQIAIQEDVIEATASDAQSVAEALETEVTGATNDLRKQMTRTLFGNGDSIICGVQTGNSTTITLAALDGWNAVERGLLFVGMPIDVGTSASEASIVDNQLITSVTESSTVPAVVTATTANVTAGTHFVSLANARAGTTAFEPNGMRNLVSTATFGGLSTASVPTWAANVDTTAQPLTISLVLQAHQKVRQKSGEYGNIMLTGLKQERKLYEQLQQQVRYGSDSKIDVGNQDAPTWHGMEIMAHPDCPNEDLYVGKKEDIFYVASRKPFWQNAITGGNILAWIQGTSSYGGKLAFHYNLVAQRRNTWFRLGGLN
jgi:hypothetical protein